MKALFVIGPSGCGKTTLSSHLLSVYTKIFGANSASLINLDPANESGGHADIDIKELVTIEDIM